MTKPKFHASLKAKSQRRKRSPRGRHAYNSIVKHGMDLYDGNYYHPNMNLPKNHMETIVHNIGWIVADEITAIDKAF